MNDVASSGAGIQTAMLDAVCDALTAAFIVYDRNDEITFASKQLLAYFPVSEEFIKPGARLKDLLRQVYDCRDVSGHSPSGSGSAVNREEWLAERLASHWKERAEHQERHGTDRWIRYSKRRLPSGIGICVVTDISEQKKREDQWRADLERVQLTEEILDSLPFPILVKDRNMSYVAVNHATCTLLESPADCILGRTVFDIHARELASRIDSGDRKVLETGIPSIIPERLTRLDGEEAVIITRKHRVGKPGRYFLVTTMEDITPMTVMDENGERIIPGIEHLAFERSTYKARGNADDAESGAFLSLAGKRILLVTANAPISSNAERRLLAAGVDFASVSNEAEQQDFLDIAVSANVAIDLVVVDTQMTLGCLDIVKHHNLSVLTLDHFELGTSLLEILGRHFSARDHFNHLSGDDDWEISTRVETAVAQANHGCDVLVVEDNAINKIVFSQILEGLGFTYVVATSGEEALQLFSTHSPSIVLMDATLPDFDGFEACRRLRLMESADTMMTRVPIIGVIPQAFEGDRQACLSAGMDDMLLKPISPDIIETMFKRLLPVSAKKQTM